jgi:RNA polymerase sigma-70 factor, ECF subfamily
MEERQAIARLQNGQLIGLEYLVEKYQVQAVQAAGLILLDRAAAEDIVQKAFISLVENIHQFDAERPFKPWFFRSVVNASIKAANRQKRQISLNQPQNQQKVPLEEVLADTDPLPEVWLEEKENRQRLQQAIDQLPPNQRAVIVMHYFLELSESDMAEEMDRPKSTIKYWLRTARMQLIKLLPLRNSASQPETEKLLVVPEKDEEGVWHE